MIRSAGRAARLIHPSLRGRLWAYHQRLGRLAIGPVMASGGTAFSMPAWGSSGSTGRIEACSFSSQFQSELWNSSTIAISQAETRVIRPRRRQRRPKAKRETGRTHLYWPQTRRIERGHVQEFRRHRPHGHPVQSGQGAFSSDQWERQPRSDGAGSDMAHRPVSRVAPFDAVRGATRLDLSARCRSLNCQTQTRTAASAAVPRRDGQ